MRVDPRIELMSVVFRLAGNPEYTQGRVPPYTKAVDEWFGPHKEHEVVKQARRLRATVGVSYDAVASFAVHLDGTDPPKFAVPWNPRPDRLDKRWLVPDAKSFLSNLADFAADSKAKQFFARQRELYAHAEAQMQQVIAEHADLTWFAKFFGARPTARFQVVLGLLNGGCNYGPSAKLRDGNEDLYAILGCGNVDEEGRPMFGRMVVPTLVHEYCHSYCNPIVDEHLAAMKEAGDKLFEMTAEAMRSQAYSNGRTVLCESLVRACVVRYRAVAEGDKAADEEIAEQKRNSFHWTGELAELLATDYEKNRKDFPTLHEFGPGLAAFFRDQVSKVEALLAKAPKVVSMTPANGQQDVDPATTALVVTFDRPMKDGSWAVVGGGDNYPGTKGKPPSYDDSRKVLTVPIKLKPDWSYELWLNHGKFDTFRSEDGTPLQPVHVTFKTRAK
ncbi:MAG TPA: DUF4932 domain-containing protein [Planctomycetota bacterium]|nr:DUF4932 domain-containing protein [Planctomycetota bacterium]